jgi:DNA-binding transcriptional LysR family regulator
MFELRHLRVLREVAERGSFSAAAEALSYTQPAVSQQIAALERQAGAKLVDRTPRGIRLTDAGRALLGHAESILAQLAEAEAELEAIADVRGGMVRLSSFPTGGATLIPLALAAFRDRHPGVEVAISVAGLSEAVDRLKSGDDDLAVMLESGFGPESRDQRLDRVHLLDDPMLVALPTGHSLARRRSVRLADLADETWMQDGSSCPDATVFLRACHAAGFEPKVAFENDDYMAIQGFVAAGVGIALIPELALQGVREDVVVRPLAGRTPKRRVVAATPAGGHRSPATDAMLDVLRAVSADYQARHQPALVASASS